MTTWGLSSTTTRGGYRAGCVVGFGIFFGWQTTCCFDESVPLEPLLPLVPLLPLEPAPVRSSRQSLSDSQPM